MCHYLRCLPLALFPLFTGLPAATDAARADEVVRVEATPRPVQGAVPVTHWHRGEYWKQVFLYAWNDSSSIIDAADWKLNIPSSLNGYLDCVSWQRPYEEDDFFDSVPLFWGYYGYPGEASGAITEQIGGGASPGESGALQFYEFDVANNAPLGPFDFTVDNLAFGDPGSGFIPWVITNNYSFEIYSKRGDNNGDGTIDANDVNTLVGVLTGTDTDPNHIKWCDLNDDGFTDARDIQPFIEHYLGG